MPAIRKIISSSTGGRLSRQPARAKKGVETKKGKLILFPARLKKGRINIAPNRR